MRQPAPVRVVLADPYTLIPDAGLGGAGVRVRLLVPVRVVLADLDARIPDAGRLGCRAGRVRLLVPVRVVLADSDALIPDAGLGAVCGCGSSPVRAAVLPYP
ncbi:MAG: hypothetical protein H5T76_26620 [Streptomyces sp.]|nr:hypothetical protein [Streptomyces sp.]